MIRLIVATDPNGLIGIKYKYVEDGSPPEGELGLAAKRNWYFRWKMPWYYKQDLRRFKKTTMGSTLIMGRRTFESLPGILPGRFHIILSRDDGYFQNEAFAGEDTQAMPAESLEEALRMAKQIGNDVWIAGGKQIYDLALETGGVEEIDHTFVPEVDLSKFENIAETTTFDLSILDDYELRDEVVNPKDERLTHRRFRCPLPAFS